MNSTGHNDAALPSVEWKPVWPVTWAVPGLITVALLAAAFGLGAVTALCLAVSSMLDGGTAFTLVGACGGAVALAGFAAAIVSRSELLNNRFSLGVQRHVDPIYGEGVLLINRRVGLPLIVILAGFATYGVFAWFDWQDGSGDALLPVSKNSSGGANFILVLAIALIVLLIPIAPRIFRKQTEVSLYPTGIHWAEAPHLGGATVFVEWTDIESIRRGEISIPRATFDVIDIYPNRSADGGADRPDHFVVPAHRLVCDPNTLIGVMRYVHEHPEHRGVLANPAVSQLFAPPPLRERMRLSRSTPAPAPKD